MPRRNGTGPEGKGPVTGRGFGQCGANTLEDTDDRQVGRGLGPCGRGMANRRKFNSGGERHLRGRRF